VVCHNPDAAERDAATRERLIAQLEAMIDGSDLLTPTKRAELRGVISTQPGPDRFLRTTPSGLPRLDAAKVAADAKLDGKYLLRTNDPRLSGEDIARGYKQLPEVERRWRDMKRETRRLNTALDLPLPPRIPAPGRPEFSGYLLWVLIMPRSAD
jgi:hypothetical protein